MRTLRARSYLPVVLIALGFSSCEHPLTLETRLREDGSATRSVIFEKTDSAVLRENMFGVSESKGWKISVSVNEGEASSDRYRIRFDKEFSSAEAMNAELDAGNDSLFHIHAVWEKQFRWFYTYIRYEETYRPINRFKFAPAEDFFNEEDRQFIRRLPADGSKLTKPDSVFLHNLDRKIGDQYAAWAIFEEQMDILRKLINRSGLGPRWLDTLSRHNRMVYESIEQDKGNDQFALAMADTLGIPLPARARQWADSLSQDFNSRLRFMSYARDSRYRVMFEVPWAVTDTNADSVSGNRAYWRPLPHAFMFDDHTFYVEARRPNTLLLIISIVLVAAGIFFLFRKAFR
jgi:hypothetical protein